jgi:hypothetical protein
MSISSSATALPTSTRPKSSRWATAACPTPRRPDTHVKPPDTASSSTTAASRTTARPMAGAGSSTCCASGSTARAARPTARWRWTATAAPTARSTATRRPKARRQRLAGGGRQDGGPELAHRRAHQQKESMVGLEQARQLSFRPAQYSSDDHWNNLIKAGIDPVKDLGYTAKPSPPISSSANSIIRTIKEHQHDHQFNNQRRNLMKALPAAACRSAFPQPSPPPRPIRGCRRRRSSTMSPNRCASASRTSITAYGAKTCKLTKVKAWISFEEQDTLDTPAPVRRTATLPSPPPSRPASGRRRPRGDPERHWYCAGPIVLLSNVNVHLRPAPRLLQQQSGRLRQVRRHRLRQATASCRSRAGRATTA